MLHPAPPGLAAPPLFWEVLERRRTVRFYTEDPVAGEVVTRLMRAAVMAPSAHNGQPWRFVVLNDRARRQRLVNAMAKRWERDLRKSAVDPKIIRAEVRFSTERFVNAPLLLLPCLTMESMDRYPDRARQRAEYAMAIQSVAAGIQNLLLAAHAEGLGACWCCAPLFCQGLVRRLLDLPQDWEPQALITLGRPRHDPPVPPRRSLSELTWTL